ncbi:MAG: urease accessory protein [Bacteroidota bacterium]|jgi:high-affinity nickel permease
MEIAPLLLASVIGFSHAFEADHLVAVSNIVTQRNNVFLSIKDGIYWGLGHTSTIFLMGCIFILGKFTFNENSFRYFEATVGFMLIILGTSRLYKLSQNQHNLTVHSHLHNQETHQHKLAYSVGLMHGLAGSGALILSVLTTIKGSLNGILYLIIFGFGSVIGMMLAAGVFSVPFSQKLMNNYAVRIILTVISSAFCIGLGFMVIYQNLK